MFKRYLYWNHRAFSAVAFRARRHVTAIGWLTFCGIFASAALGLDTSLSVAYQTFCFLFLLWFAAFFSVFYPHAKIFCERSLPKFGSAGEKLTYRILVRNETRRTQKDVRIIEETVDPRPSFNEFVQTPEPGEEKRNWYDRHQGVYRWKWLVKKNRMAEVETHTVPLLAPSGTTQIRAQLTPLKRGYLHLVGISVIGGDPFGLFRKFKKIPAPQSVLILPKRYPVRAIDLPGITKYQQGGVAMASAVGESEEFVSLRDYRPGDPLRHIHWKSFAKTGKPIVKEFQDEFFVRHALILDTFDVHLHSEVFEEAVSVAASFAYTIQSQDSLLDLMFVGPQAFCFTAGRGLGHVEQILEILAVVKPCSEENFATLESLVLDHISTLSGCVVVLVSWDNNRKKFIEQMKILGVPLLVFVITDTDVILDPGPMSDQPENFHVLPIGKIAGKLATL